MKEQMKITILTFGSAGDVIPYVSLALGLEKRGYTVVLAAPSNFEDYIKNTGLTTILSMETRRRF